MFGLFKNRTKKDILREAESRNLLDTLFENPDCQIFHITNSDGKMPSWTVEPTTLKLIPPSEGHYLVKAILIDEKKNEARGYLNISTPERIADYVFYDLENPKYDFIHNLKGKDVIPAVASDCFGSYELYQSKINPETGLRVLKAGLEMSKQKSVIAEDIGYILRDDNQLEEALKYFLISEKHEPSSEFIFGEIESIYISLGNMDKAQEYKTKLEEY